LYGFSAEPPSPPPPRRCPAPANAFLPALQVLKEATERIIRTHDDEEDSMEVPLGLYLVRGDNVCIVGLVDEKMDGEIDWTQVKGVAIGGTKHT
jgi:hypothetical protein